MPLDISNFRRIVVGVDPAVTANAASDETGIIVAGRTSDGRGYVLDDLSVKAAPGVWADRVVKAYWRWGADRIVAEVNQGGDLVEHLVRTVDDRVSYRAVRAVRTQSLLGDPLEGKTKSAKIIRAEPVSALYEQGRIFHARPLSELEAQLVSWSPEIKESSPDRLDALVWAFTDLFDLLQPIKIIETIDRRNIRR